ncbi:putative DNA-invertase from lambdoid prophage Rac [Dyella sp. AD56]|uniref:recombinase family protein n=1 Tax=Dyella sp. AD56 TaxID=1528744 RepID=UPI000C826B70|nr:recombinase family protein [Dyella sp. AD56]PMQ04235.1 putative DNA-invertase from lambdoid prophage Rac [Dyella sp. AD56]
MSRTFAYCRVSTTEQTTENQRLEIDGLPFQVDPRRIVMESISGSVPAMERPAFRDLVKRMEEGDVLVVTKLDRLGRNAVDVRATVDMLAGFGIRVHCMALGGADLTSPAGKLTMSVIAAVAEFELDLLKERTHAGIRRAREQGKRFGRPAALTADRQRDVASLLAAGESVSSLSKRFGTSRQTIMRIRDSARDASPSPADVSYLDKAPRGAEVFKVET